MFRGRMPSSTCGESIGGGRWTATRKRLIVASRVNATRALSESIRLGEKKPFLFIVHRQWGITGPVESGDVTEDHPPGSGFWRRLLPGSKRHWPWGNSARVVILRTGIVIGEKGGALERCSSHSVSTPAGRSAPGGNGFPWVHRDDVAASFCSRSATRRSPARQCLWRRRGWT